MKKKELLKFISILLVILVVCFFMIHGVKIGIYRIKPLTSLVVKGLDLSGGVHAEFAVSDPLSDESLNDAVDSIILKQYARIRAYGFKDVRINKTSDNTISIDIPSASNMEELLSVISQQGNLTFRFESGEVAIDGEHIVYAVSGRTSNNTPAVTFSLDEEGTASFAEITAAHIDETLGIYLDDTELASPRITKAVTDGTVTITNVGTIESAEKLAGLISSGKLDADIELVNQSVISPVLDESSLHYTVFALAAVYLLLIVYQFIKYRLGILPLLITSLFNILFVSLLILTANWTVFAIPVLYAAVCLHFLFNLLEMNVYQIASAKKLVHGSQIRKNTYKNLFLISVFMIVAGLLVQFISITAISSVGQVLIYEGASVIVFIIGFLPLLMDTGLKMLGNESDPFRSRIAKKVSWGNIKIKRKVLFLIEGILIISSVVISVFFTDFEYLSSRSLLFMILSVVAACAFAFVVDYLNDKKPILSYLPVLILTFLVLSANAAICRTVSIDVLAYMLFNILFVLTCFLAKRLDYSGWFSILLCILLSIVVFIIFPQGLLFVEFMNLFSVLVLSLHLFCVD